MSHDRRRALTPRQEVRWESSRHDDKEKEQTESLDDAEVTCVHVMQCIHNHVNSGSTSTFYDTFNRIS